MIQDVDINEPYRSNTQGSLLYDLLRYARIQPAVLQVELHPYLTQEALVTYSKTIGIAITAYSSFGPAGYVELSADKGAASLLSHDITTSIAKKVNKSESPSIPLIYPGAGSCTGPAQVLLRWATQRGIAVIPKSNDKKRLAENLDSVDFDLLEEDIKAISSLNINLRVRSPQFRILNAGLTVFVYLAERSC